MNNEYIDATLTRYITQAEIDDPAIKFGHTIEEWYGQFFKYSFTLNNVDVVLMQDGTERLWYDGYVFPREWFDLKKRVVTGDLDIDYPDYDQSRF